MKYDKNYFNRSRKNLFSRNEIVCFWKTSKLNGYMCQWFNSEMIIDGVLYQNAEQYMMAQKALLFNDTEIFNEIMKQSNPNEIKKLGRKVKNFNPEIWDKEKVNIVLKGNINKFSQNEKIKNLLLKTENKLLIEASPFDDIWGVKLKEEDNKILNINTWNGENLLGFILMEVRDILNSK